MSTKNWTIRKATFMDAEALSECMHAAYKVYSSRFPNNALPPLTANYEEEIRQYPLWIAESEGKVIGGLILVPEKKSLKIANVAVHPRFQGVGLGKALLEFAETKATGGNYSELNLVTHIALKENISFYSYLGWTETERDASRVYMQKQLM
jgi:N-acetylglutamate synthase-like GNAT family acetyltransferase